MNGETRIERIMQAFLEGRKGTVRADEDFSSRVMDSVRQWEKEKEEERRRAPGAGRPRRGSPGFRLPFRDWLDAWRRPVPRLAFSALLAAAVSALVYFADRPGPVPVPDSTRLKGEGFRLGFLLKREGRVAPAVPGTEYRPGDLLQAVYSAPAPGRVHLFSIDAGGLISCFSCASGDTLFPPAQARPLAFALELDASPKAETFAGFWSERPTPSAEVLRLIRAAWESGGRDLGKLEEALDARLPAGLQASLFTVRKKESPSRGFR